MTAPLTPHVRPPSADGAAIPVLGLGTYGMGAAELSTMIPAALAAGLTHIDTAQVYRNEDAVGELVAASGLPRSQVFLTTKMWVANYPPRSFAASLDASLRRLRTDHVDLLLLHWPSNAVPLAEQIGGLEAAVRAGKARHVGVSNFNAEMVDAAVRLSTVPIATNQFEFHPYLNQRPLLAACREAGLVATAYCPMAVGRVFGDAVLKDIAARHRKSVAQVVLRWIHQQGIATLFRSTNPSRIGDNMHIFDFALRAEEMEAIAALADPNARIVDPPGLAPAWDPTPTLPA